MSSSLTLYARLFATLRVAHPTLRITQLSNWLWIVVGLIQSQSVPLSQIALHLPSEAQATGRIAQVRRWLANPHVDVPTLYEPLIQAVLDAWGGKPVFIILDGCLVNHAHLQFFRLSLSHCFRALPLDWLVVEGKGLIQMEACATLLAHTARLLQHSGSVTFLADRGFRDTDWATECLKYGWNYLIRVANSTFVELPDGRCVPLTQLGVTPGRARYFQNVRLRQDKRFACNLMVTGTPATPKQPAEVCAIMTNLPPQHSNLKAYLKRMHIEQSFRDDKSGGFDLGATKLRDPERLNHLLLALAVAVLWIYEIGEPVLRADERTEIDPAYKRQLSVFQIGWRKLRRTISCATIPAFTLSIKPFRLESVWRKC
jgi:Transposase DDE domain